MKNKQACANSQLFVLLLACLISDFLLPGLSVGQQTMRAQTVLLGLAAQGVLLWGLFVLLCNTVVNFRQFALCRYLLMGAVLASLALELAQGQRFYSHAQASVLSMGAFLLLMFGAAFYGVYSGLHALCRTAGAILTLCAASLLFLFLSLVPQLHFTGLEPGSLSLEQVVQASWAQLYLPPELLLWSLFAQEDQQGKTRCAGQGAKLFALLFGIQAFVAILGEMAMGSSYWQQEQPVFNLARLGGISVFRRLDALHGSVWLLLLLLKITVYCLALVQLLKYSRPSMPKHLPYALAVAGVLAMFVILRSGSEQLLYQWQQWLLIAAAVSVLVRGWINWLQKLKKEACS